MQILDCNDTLAAGIKQSYVMKKHALSAGLLACLALTTMLTSCSKSNTLSAEEQLEGKWTMKTAIGHYTVMGSSWNDTTTFTTNDYMRFNADGTLFILESGDTTTGKWKVANSKLMITETNYMDYPNGFDISTLNSSKLQLHYAETNANNSMDQILNLEK